MSDRWIIGDFVTGRLMTEITSPGPKSSWEVGLTSARGELELIPTVRLHRVVGEMLRDKLGYRYYIAAVNERNIIEYAGPVTDCTLAPDSWLFSAGSAWDYLERRTVVNRDTWFSWQGNNPPVFHWTGTWRQIIAGLWDSVFNFGYGGWVKDQWLESVEQQAAWQAFFGSARRVDGPQGRGDPPIIPVGSQTEGGGRHEWSCDLLDMDSTAEVLKAINGRESGVEIQIIPRWHGEFPSGVMIWEITTGIDPAPLVIPTSIAPWPLDVAAQASRAVVGEWRMDATQAVTIARVLGGRSGGDGVPFIGFANTAPGYQGKATALEGSPEINAADTSHTSIVKMATANDRARAMFLDGAIPASSCEVTIQPGGALNPDLIRPGDMVSLYGGENHAFMPPGVQKMRVLRKARVDDGAARFGLVGLRFPDLERYGHMWAQQEQAAGGGR